MAGGGATAGSAGIRIVWPARRPRSWCSKRRRAVSAEPASARRWSLCSASSRSRSARCRAAVAAAATCSASSLRRRAWPSSFSRLRMRSSAAASSPIAWRARSASWAVEESWRARSRRRACSAWARCSAMRRLRSRSSSDATSSSRTARASRRSSSNASTRCVSSATPRACSKSGGASGSSGSGSTVSGGGGRSDTGGDVGGGGDAGAGGGGPGGPADGVGAGGATVSVSEPSPGAGTATGRGTITVPNWSHVRPRSGAIQPGMVKLRRHTPGPVPPRLGGSGIAGYRWRRPSASMTSVGWPVLTGRRRRHRPVIRTVRFPPLSADHSTDSIDTADVPGNSLTPATVRRAADGCTAQSYLLPLSASFARAIARSGSAPRPADAAPRPDRRPAPTDAHG